MTKSGLQIREALINLSRAKLRTGLALLGILVGTASVVAMVSGGKLATNATLKQIQSLGTDLLGVSISYSPSRNKAQTADQPKELTLQAAMSISTTSSSISAVSPYTQSYANVSFEGNKLQAQVVGVTSNLADIVHAETHEGRFISFLDDISMQCVIGNKVSQDILPSLMGSALGQQIKLGNQYCTVVGVLQPWSESGFISVNLNKAIILPINVTLAMNQYTHINNVVVKLTKSHAAIDDITQSISHYLSKQLPGSHVYFRSPQQLLDSMKKQSNILTVFLGFIGGISLLVGGIGVMNIMLVSVIERRREIGLRLAVGARHVDIQLLFFIEALVITVLGGLLGVGLGVLISYGVAVVKGWTFSFFILPPVVGFLVSVCVGIFFGFYPAFKASRLSPIEALRSD